MNIFFSSKNKRHIRKQLQEKLKFNYILIIILVFLLGLLIFSVVNLIMVINLRHELKKAQSEITAGAEENTPMRYYDDQISKVIIPDAVNVQVGSSSKEVSTEPAQPTISTPTASQSPWKYNVFGDGFSNSYYVDMDKTNFHYDDMATAFYFSPSYEKRDDGACAQAFCGFQSEQKTEFCLTGGSKLCLAWDGEKLRYDGGEVKDFTALFYGCGGKPDRVSIYPLEKSWLIGAVWTEDGREIGRAWRFDGKRLTVLDPENRVAFLTRQGYSGSNIYFGGDENNFIVLYSGYDLIGYQVVNNTLWNITDFFNTRLAEGGFAPQIIKHRQGEETVWYICSQTENKPKLIKMWQNGSEVIRGLASLGEEFFAGGYNFALCREGADGYLNIATEHNKWSLIDKGFDQSRDYQAVSIDLSSNTGVMKMANFSGLSLCGAASCGSNALKDNLSFKIASNSDNWQTPVFGQEYLFVGSGSQLFWKLQALADKNKSYYSPWFGAVNSVYYAWAE